jgi:hypothetical protein
LVVGRLESMTTWKHVIESALLDLGRFLRASDWYGRENELVNLFAHSFLAGRSGPKGPIHASQLGIEVAVKQLSRAGGKTLVRKDLVIWRKENQTVWAQRAAANDPAAIVEFKVNDNKKCARDLAWLSNYTELHPSVTGFSVCGFLQELRGVSFVSVAKGISAVTLFAPDDVLPRKLKKGKLVSSRVRVPT